MAKAPDAWTPVVGQPAETRFERELVTPEGVDLRLRLAEASERAAAFLLDAAIMAAAVAEAMGHLAGRRVGCHVESVGQATGRPAVVGGQLIGGISSEQRRQVEQDPAVRANQ